MYSGIFSYLGGADVPVALPVKPVPCLCHAGCGSAVARHALVGGETSFAVAASLPRSYLILQEAGPVWKAAGATSKMKELAVLE